MALKNKKQTDTIIQLGKTMDMDVIAQGIEQPATIDYLSSKQCTHLQGFGISEPLSGDDFSQWYNNFSSLQSSLRPLH